MSDDNTISSSSRQGSSRREFLSRTAGAVAAAAPVLSPAPLRARPLTRASRRVLGANDRIQVGFIGCGMQFYGLIRRFQERRDQLKDIELVALSDVWEPRLKHAQEKTGAPHLHRDYRELIARSDVDGVVIAVPDHWHFQMADEACRAGKDVYLEKPMTYTIEESARLNEVVQQTKTILQVGGSGPSTRLYHQIHDVIRAGRVGKVLWGLISYNRNTRTGMWDYPIPGVGSEHWPDAEVSERNLDWKMWLGSAPPRPFDLDRYFRWRKYWDYSGGNATDLLYHRLGAMSTMIGFDFPSRVTGAGGIYVQKENREVPDTYMTLVEYPQGYTVNMISCMANSESAPLSLYANWGTIQILRKTAAQMGDSMGDQRRGARQASSEYAVITAQKDFEAEFKAANEGRTEVTIEPEESRHLIDDWLDCMRSRQQPLYDVLKGYQVMVAIKLGVDSYREGRVAAFDPVERKVLSEPPDRPV